MNRREKHCPGPSLLRTIALCALACASGIAGAEAADCADPTATLRMGQGAVDPRSTPRAIVVGESSSPLDWTLIDGQGQAVAHGQSLPFGPDALSGQRTQRIDLPAGLRPGAGYRLDVQCAGSREFEVSARPYLRLRDDALAYFYHHRSSVPIEARYAGGPAWARPAGHPSEIVGCRSGEDQNGNRWPGCEYELDVTGGWYDAGDHGKYVVNGGITVWTLLNLHERARARGRDTLFGDGPARIPESGNGVDDLLDEVRYELEFLLRMQAPPGATASIAAGERRARADLRLERIEAAGLVHHKIADRHWTPLPTPPQLDREPRSLHPVSTAATLNLAAVAAQCARVWRSLDTSFANRCLAAARTAYAAAQRHPDVYFVSSFDGSGGYGDGELSDEFYWAAVELYLATGEPDYERALRASPHFARGLESEPSWQQTAGAGHLSLALLPSALADADRRRLQAGVIAQAERFATDRQRSGYHVPNANPAYPWGSNGLLLNRSIVLAVAHDLSGRAEFRAAVVDAMDYLLGRNAPGVSYVSGHGRDAMQHPHHRFWAHSLDPALPPPPPGALSGGPNSTNPADPLARELAARGCAPQACWVDDLRSYATNEVAINWNAPLVWVASYLDEGAR